MWRLFRSFIRLTQSHQRAKITFKAPLTYFGVTLPAEMTWRIQDMWRHLFSSLASNSQSCSICLENNKKKHHNECTNISTRMHCFPNISFIHAYAGTGNKSYTYMSHLRIISPVYTMHFHVFRVGVRAGWRTGKPQLFTHVVTRLQPFVDDQI